MILFAKDYPKMHENQTQIPKLDKVLQESDVAKKELIDTLKPIVEARHENNGRGVSQNEIYSLDKFIRRNPNARASLSAMFIIGNAYFSDGTQEEKTIGKPFFELIVKDYPNTPEAALANVQLTLYDMHT